MRLFKREQIIDKRLGFRKEISNVIYCSLSDWLIRLSEHTTILLLSLVDVLEWNLRKISIIDLITSWPESPSIYLNREQFVSQLKNSDSPYLRHLIYRQDHRFQILWGTVLEYYLFMTPALIKFLGGVSKISNSKKIGANREDINQIISNTVVSFSKECSFTAEFMNEQTIKILVGNIHYLAKYNTIQNWESQLTDDKHGYKLTTSGRFEGIDENLHILSMNSYYNINRSLGLYYDFLIESKNTFFLLQNLLGSDLLNSKLWNYLCEEYNDIIFGQCCWALYGCYENSTSSRYNESFWRSVKEQLIERGYEIE